MAIRPLLLCGLLLPILGAELPGQSARTVLYLADQNFEDVVELFAVDLKTGEVTRLNGNMVVGGDVSEDEGDVLLDRKGKHALFIADATADDVWELFHVDLKTGQRQTLNAPLVAGGAVAGGDMPIAMDRNGRVAYYRADQDTDDVDELYRVDLKTLERSKASAPLVEDGDVDSFRISRKGRLALYVADQDTDGVNELYASDAQTGEVVRVNGPLVSGGDVITSANDLSRNRRHAVYIADQDTNGIRELYHTDLKTGEVTRLNQDLVEGGEANWFVMDHRARWITYQAEQETEGVEELYRVVLSSGEVTKVSGEEMQGGFISGGGLVLGPKGRRVFYEVTDDRSFVAQIYMADLKTGEVTRLNADLPEWGDVRSAQVDLKGRGVVYLADQETDEREELYRHDLKTGEVSKLNPPLVEDGEVESFAVGPKGKSVVYTAEQETEGMCELFHVDVASGEVTRINPPLVDGGGVGSFQIGPKGRYVVYEARQDEAGVTELYLADLKKGTVTKLNLPLVEGGRVREFWINRDGPTSIEF